MSYQGRKRWKRTGVCILILWAVAGSLLTGYLMRLLLLQAAETEDAQRKLRHYEKSLFVAVRDLSAGETITEDKVGKELRYTDEDIAFYMSAGDFGKVLLTDVREGECLPKKLLINEEESYREVVLSGIETDGYIKKGDRIDIRISYGNAEEDGSRREKAYAYYHTVENGIRHFYLAAGSETDTRNGQMCGQITLTKGIRIKKNAETETIWEGKFRIPADTFVVLENQQKTFLEYAKRYSLNGEENFFVTEGYLLIIFKIEVFTGQNRYLFDHWKETDLAADIIALGWQYHDGDIIRYDLSKSIADDYEVGGIE